MRTTILSMALVALISGADAFAQGRPPFRKIRVEVEAGAEA